MLKKEIKFIATRTDKSYKKMNAEELQNYLNERSRGCGRHKSKKDYSRKQTKINLKKQY